MTQVFQWENCKHKYIIGGLNFTIHKKDRVCESVCLCVAANESIKQIKKVNY